MPVVGGGNADGINGGIGDHIPEIGDSLALGELGFLVFLVVIIDKLGTGFTTDPVTVANSLNDHCILLDKAGQQNGTGLNTVPDKAHVHFFFSRFCGCLFGAFSRHKNFSP